jgi:ribosomal-protein-alanine N-acetyltransferase
MNQHEIRHIFKNPPVLTTDRLILRMIQRDDYRDMYAYAHREEVTRYLLWSPHPSEEYTRFYVRNLQKFYRNGLFYDWAILLKSENRMIGTVGFTRLDSANHCGEIGYVEAAEAVLLFGFLRLNLNRIEARCMVENHASLRVMEKLGMKYEGTFRQLLLVKGKFVDVIVCAITKDQWQRISDLS